MILKVWDGPKESIGNPRLLSPSRSFGIAERLHKQLQRLRLRHCRRAGVDIQLGGVAVHMPFCSIDMPNGMFLRSDCGWHIDPLAAHTVYDYLQLKGLKANEVEPIPRDFFVEYASWFQEEKNIEVHSALASSLNYVSDRFETLLQNGEKIASKCVVVATGFGYFKHVPDELLRILAPFMGF